MHVKKLSADLTAELSRWVAIFYDELEVVMKTFLFFISFLFLSCSQHGRHGMHHDFKDAEAWSKKFDDPKRDNWQKPKELVQLMKIKRGQVVADIGAGTGYMLKHLSQAVGSKGKVYALDVEPNLVEFMKKRVVGEKLTNVEVQRIPYSSPNLGGKKVNKVLFVNTWHHIRQRIDYAREMAAGIQSGGQVYIVEPEPQSGGPGPSDPHRMSPDEVMEELNPSGFRCQVLKESLPHQFVIRCS